MAEFPTSRGSWPWPWIGSYCIPSCISRRPLPTQRISLKSKNVFVDGQTDVRAEGHLRPTILGRLRGVDIKIWKHVRALYAESRKKVQDNENDIKALQKIAKHLTFALSFTFFDYWLKNTNMQHKAGNKWQTMQRYTSRTACSTVYSTVERICEL